MMKRILPVFLLATFLATADTVVYLATNGDDATGALNDNAHPYATLYTAIAALGIDGGTVSVAAGTYSLTMTDAPDALQGSVYTKGASCIRIAAPVEVVGATGNPADVVFQRDSSVANARVFMLDHAAAKLRFLTIQNGKFSDGIYNGGNVLIGYSGGTVEDCVLKNGNAGNANNTNIGGGNIALMAGRCSRCVITGGTLGHYRPIGLNVMAAGSSVVENCLITKSKCTYSHEAAADEGAVALKDSARLVNCTVVANTANRFSGVNILSGNARAINCIIYGNTVTYETDARNSTSDVSANGVSKNRTNVGCYVNCGTDLDTSVYQQLNATCFTVAAADFVNADNENWMPHLNASTRDMGSDYSESGAVSATDLAGNVRTMGGAVDVGCYELTPAFHLNATVDSLSFVVNANDTAHFTAIPGDPVGTVTYVWDFGDGSLLLTTTETSVSHKYTEPGTYSVSVLATCTAGTAEFDFAEPIMVYAFSATFSRSADITLVGTNVVFTAETESAVPVSYTWDFGDGTTQTTTATQVTHSYAAPGQYTVSVVADGGAAGTTSYAFETPLDVFFPDVYVSFLGSTPTFPYGTMATAAKSLDVVWPYLTDGMTLHVAPGTYQTKDWQLVVSNAVTIVGEGETPNDVVFHNGWANFNNGTRNMLVRNPDALVANVTLMGGWSNYAKGGNLLLESGTVSNCVLSSGGSNSSGGSGGAAYISGGLLTHCVVTNSYLGNRGNGITIYLENGRVSNCLITKNRRSWSGSRNAFSLFYAAGGIVDNCTIADCWILKNNPNNTLQMGTASDKGVNIAAGATAYNLAIADIRWDIAPANGEDRDTLLKDIGKPQSWTGVAASFVNCATDDPEPINPTCGIGTTETFFSDYEAGNLVPKLRGALYNKGIAVANAPAADLAGMPRLSGLSIDIGCYENQIDPRTILFLR